MPRPWLETVQPWTALAQGRWHRCRVINVQKNRKPAGVRVTFEHLEQPQAGRRHEVIIELPIRPAGPTNEFFRACGFEVQDGSDIAPKDAVGKTVEVRFLRTDGDTYHATGFRPTNAEKRDGQQTV